MFKPIRIVSAVSLIDVKPGQRFIDMHGQIFVFQRAGWAMGFHGMFCIFPDGESDFLSFSRAKDNQLETMPPTETRIVPFEDPA